MGFFGVSAGPPSQAARSGRTTSSSFKRAMADRCLHRAVWKDHLEPRETTRSQLIHYFYAQMLHVWNIYRHLPQKWPSDVGKYSSTMEHLGQTMNTRHCSNVHSRAVAAINQLLPVIPEMLRCYVLLNSKARGNSLNLIPTRKSGMDTTTDQRMEVQTGILSWISYEGLPSGEHTVCELGNGQEEIVDSPIEKWWLSIVMSTFARGLQQWFIIHICCNCARHWSFQAS